MTPDGPRPPRPPQGAAGSADPGEDEPMTAEEERLLDQVLAATRLLVDGNLADREYKDRLHRLWSGWLERIRGKSEA